MSNVTALRHTCPEHHFGCCPECGQTDGYLNIGRGHWFYCAEHKVRWLAGENLLSTWRDQSEAEQRARYEALGFESYRVIEPSEAYPGSPVLEP